MNQLIGTVDQLKARQIGFRSLTEAIDTTTPAGELFFHIFGALAQFERSIIRERTNAGLKAALARGRKGGRRPKVKADDIRAALTLLNDPELSVRRAAAKLGLSVSPHYRHAPGLRSLSGRKAAICRALRGSTPLTGASFLLRSGLGEPRADARSAVDLTAGPCSISGSLQESALCVRQG